MIEAQPKNVRADKCSRSWDANIPFSRRKREGSGETNRPSLRLTIGVNLRVNPKPCLLFVGAEMRHYHHEIADHLLPNPPNECGTLLRDANHDLAPIFARDRADKIAEIFQPLHQAARRSCGVHHFLRDGRHRHHFLLIQRGQEKKLREGNVTRRELLREAQDEAALQLEDNVGQTFSVRLEIMRRSTDVLI